MGGDDESRAQGVLRSTPGMQPAPEAPPSINEASTSKDVWRFIDTASAVLLETGDVGLIRSKLLDGSLPVNARCRKGGVGEFATIAKSIAKAEFQIGVLIDPVMAHVRQGATLGSGGIGCLAFLGLLIFEIGMIISQGFQGLGIIVALIPGLVVGVFAAGLAGGIAGATIGLVVGLVRAPALKRARPAHLQS